MQQTLREIRNGNQHASNKFDQLSQTHRFTVPLHLCMVLRNPNQSFMYVICIPDEMQLLPLPAPPPPEIPSACGWVEYIEFYKLSNHN